MEKRKDNKGRILRDGEYQKSDGRYEYRYLNHKGELKSVYSWGLVETDKTLQVSERLIRCEKWKGQSNVTWKTELSFKIN